MAANFTLHLAEWGLEVCQHVEHLPLRVPLRTTLIIVLKSACCHSLSAAATLVAAKRQIQVVVVDHHWTQAEDILRRSGVLDKVNPPVVDLSVAYWAEARVAELDSELSRLQGHLAQAEDLILEQGQALNELQKQVAQQQVDLDCLRAEMGSPWRELTLKELRHYATYTVGLKGASKIHGGKAALIQRIQQMQGSIGPSDP
jgi:uncharacterized coiled-coil protein SlyX